MARNDILARLAVMISANTAELNRGLNDASKNITSFSNGVQDMAAKIGIAFSATAVANFAFEVSKLAGEAEGVRAAFEKLPQSSRLMQELKSATAGTVSELDLMKRTVQAANFGISLQALPKLLEFAAVRAQQTGQSVDYLVDSIVTGIGRKSPLILDNLGISAVALREKLDGVSVAEADIGTVAEAVGRIAEDELKKMGSLADTAALKTQRLNASWEDFKVTLGNAVNQTGIVDKTLGMLTNLLKAFSGDELTTGINQLKAASGQSSEILENFAAAGGKIDLSWQELMAKGFFRNEDAAKKYEKILAEIQGRHKSIAEDAAAVVPTETVKPAIETLAALQDKIKKLNEEFENINSTDLKALSIKGEEIKATNELIGRLEALRKARQPDPQMLTKFGKDRLNKEASGIGVDGVDINLPELKTPAGFNDLFQTDTVLTNGDAIIQKVEEVDGVFAALDANNEVRAARDRARAEAQQAAYDNMRNSIQTLGSEISGSLQQSISANESFGQSLARLAKQVVAANLARALSSAIAKSFESSKNPIVGGILAGVATAGVFALFNKIPTEFRSGGGGGGGGGSAGGGISIQRMPSQSFGETVSFNAEFVIAGDNLKAVANNQDYRNGRLG